MACADVQGPGDLVKDKHTVLGAQSAKGMLGVLGWEGMLGEDT